MSARLRDQDEEKSCIIDNAAPCHEHSRCSLAPPLGALLFFTVLRQHLHQRQHCAQSSTELVHRRSAQILARRQTRPDQTRPDQTGPDWARLDQLNRASSALSSCPLLPFPIPHPPAQPNVSSPRRVSSRLTWQTVPSVPERAQKRGNMSENKKKKRYNYKSMALGCVGENRHRHRVVEWRAGPRRCGTARPLASGSHSSGLAVATASRRGRGEAKEIMGSH
jgi:hypothetical protein